MHKPLAPVGAIADKEVSFRALRVFSEIMRTGSATAAGKQLSLSQPAVSRLIAQLEANVGFDLFYRDRGKLVPTADGIKLLQEVELTLASLDRFNSMVRDIAGYSAGTVRVVAPPSFAEGVLPDIVSQFRERFPGVEFSIDSRSVETARSMIAMRYVDCGFVKLPADESDLAVEQVVSSGSVCVLHEDRHRRPRADPAGRRTPLAHAGRCRLRLLWPAAQRRDRNPHPWFGLRARGTGQWDGDFERAARKTLSPQTAHCPPLRPTDPAPICVRRVECVAALTPDAGIQGRSAPLFRRIKPACDFASWPVPSPSAHASRISGPCRSRSSEIPQRSGCGAGFYNGRCGPDNAHAHRFR